MLHSQHQSASISGSLIGLLQEKGGETEDLEISRWVEENRTTLP